MWIMTNLCYTSTCQNDPISHVGFARHALLRIYQNHVMTHSLSWYRVVFPQKNYMTLSASRFVLLWYCWCCLSQYLNVLVASGGWNSIDCTSHPNKQAYSAIQTYQNSGELSNLHCEYFIPLLNDQLVILLSVSVLFMDLWMCCFNIHPN